MLLLFVMPVCLCACMHAHVRAFTHACVHERACVWECISGLIDSLNDGKGCGLLLNAVANI